MELTIKTADNGYILTYHEELEKGVWEERHIAVEDVAEDSNCLGEARITQKLLWEITEYFGLDGSKHDEERIHISVRNQKGEEIE